jgi:hypothetical protein
MLIIRGVNLSLTGSSSPAPATHKLDTRVHCDSWN